MIIRKAEIKDFLEISQLDRIAWGKNKDADFVPDGEHSWRLWVEHALVFCAVDDDKIIGVILAFPTNNSSEYFLHKIFIDYNYRNKKVGQKLFEPLCNSLDELKVDCILTTDPINKVMIHTCSKFGFIEKKLVKGYYREYEDRYVITRKYTEK